jgi:polysaccharide export outer membrane protein
LKKVTVLFCIFFVFGPSFLFSQEPVENKTLLMIESLKDASMAPVSYKLGPGDRLLLNLWGNVDAEYNIRISQDGTIFIPRSEKISTTSPVTGYSPTVPPSEIIPALGELEAEGLTVNELQESIEKRVSKYFRGVNVRLTLIILRQIVVSIHGSVENPGVYSITPLYRLSNLIELADSIIMTGSYRNIKIKSKDGSSNTYDLYEFLYKGNMEQNPYIKSGDIVMVPQAEMSAKITGRVYRDGNYELKKGDHLKDLIEFAGGIKKRGSLTRNIKVYNIKEPEEITEIDPYKLLIEDDSLSNIQLKTGDVVSIPMEPFTVTVVGQVTKGGTFEYEPGADFSYYLGLAGGYGERANEGDVRVTRWGGGTLKWKHGVEIKPGDTIVIGRSELKGWKDYLEVTLDAANLVFIIWTVATYK